MNAKRAITTIIVITILAVTGYFIYKFVNKPATTGEVIDNTTPLKRTIINGKISEISTKEISVITESGIETFVISPETRIIDNKNLEVNLTYLVPGIEVGITRRDDIAAGIVIADLPMTVVMSPSSPVGMKFNMEAFVHSIDNDSIKVVIQNTRTGDNYLEKELSLPAGSEYYKKVAFETDLKTASSILDGDNLKVSFISSSETKEFSFTYKGGITANLKVPFLKGSKCGAISLQSRLISASRSSIRASIEEIMIGPTESEAKEGLKTAFPGTIKINRLQFDNGGKDVIIDFSKELFPALSDACVARGLKSQLETIMKQFPSIDSYEFKIDGEAWFKK